MSIKFKRSAVVLAACIVMSAGTGTQAFAASGDGSSGFVNLTAQQETCLATAKSAVKGTKGSARKATIKAAAQSCGVWKRFSKLTSEQQACLASNGLSRPAGLPTPAQRKMLRALASTCGVTIKVKR